VALRDGKGRERRGHRRQWPQDINQLINGQLGLLDQLHQGQQGLPILPQKMNQRLGIILVDGVIGFLHGGSLLYQRIRSPILNESGLRTAAQPPTETRAPSDERMETFKNRYSFVASSTGIGPCVSLT
jgi:hypothetical protein